MTSRLAANLGSALALFTALAASPALGVDGRIEISGACAAVGCFAGDAAGFPVTISSPGSYVLTSDLALPNTNTSGIELTTGRVAIDLGGYSIAAPGTCTGCPVSSCTGGTGRGIYSTGALAVGVAIRNGAIAGMGAAGIDINGGVELERVLASQNGGSGASALSGLLAFRSVFVNNGADGLFGAGGFAAKVSDSQTTCNLDEGIEVGAGSTVSNATAVGNGGDGISVLGGSVVSGSSARSNAGVGIRAVDSSVVGNSAQGNASDGIFILGGSTVTANTVQGNGGAGIFCGDGVTASTNTVRSNVNFGLILGGGSGYLANVLTCNNSGGVCNNGVQVGGVGINLGSNICGTDTLCP